MSSSSSSGQHDATAAAAARNTTLAAARASSRAAAAATALDELQLDDNGRPATDEITFDTIPRRHAVELNRPRRWVNARALQRWWDMAGKTHGPWENAAHRPMTNAQAELVHRRAWDSSEFARSLHDELFRFRRRQRREREERERVRERSRRARAIAVPQRYGPPYVQRRRIFDDDDDDDRFGHDLGIPASHLVG